MDSLVDRVVPSPPPLWSLITLWRGNRQPVGSQQAPGHSSYPPHSRHSSSWFSQNQPTGGLEQASSTNKEAVTNKEVLEVLHSWSPIRHRHSHGNAVSAGSLRAIGRSVSLNSSFCNENTSRILFRSFTVGAFAYRPTRKGVRDRNPHPCIFF